MRLQLRSLVAAVALVLLAGSASLPAVDIYVLSNNSTGGSTPTDFGSVDSATGAYTSIASLTGNIWNLAWNPNAGNFFATAVGAAPTLQTLTSTGTLSSSLGTIGKAIYGMAYRTTNSTLYGYEFNDVTGTINSSNGAWTILNGNPGTRVNSPTGGRYSIMNDVMYFAGNFTSPVPGIGTMGYTNTSTYQQIAANSTYDNIVLANDGTTMYGIFGNGSAGQQKLYTINTATGALTAGPTISGAGLGTYFHGAGIVPVPEPSTYALAAIATCVMAAVTRRRKARKG